MSESEKHTVLVLGAGASKPYGFPLGKELIDGICKGFPAVIEETMQHRFLPGDFPDSKEFARNKNAQVARASAFCTALRESSTSSIDEFLESRDDLQKDGKYAIASILLEYERKSVLHGLQIEDDWYRRFSKWLLPPKKEDFPKNKVFIITFNYDRSLEHYLFLAVRSLYPLDESEAGGLLAQVPIVHVYGSLGRLPWQKSVQGGTDAPVAFGADPSTDPSDVVTIAAENIHVIHEEESNADSNFTRAQQGIAKASSILFLGFGYHEANIRRLFRANLIPDQERRFVTIAGTAEGLGTGEIANALALLRRCTQCDVHQKSLWPFQSVKFLKEAGHLL